eukprot:scaffold32506_cov61-Phaeocystis_antarctica.AAC.3
MGNSVRPSVSQQSAPLLHGESAWRVTTNPSPNQEAGCRRGAGGVDIVKRNRSHVVGRTPALRPLVVPCVPFVPADKCVRRAAGCGPSS